ncbi:MAG: nitrate- and nitrite sensing domain-containing protein, partial [Dechloromonas sp.]|nr:nitrate- and nitrite sensing domain-containing protein [Dechloromonas sp.]
MTSDDRLQSSAPRITQDSLAPIRRNATWLLVVFLLALSFFAIHSLVERYDQLRNASLDRKWMGASGSISRLIHELQRERGLSSGVIASRGDRFGDMLVAQQKLTDASLGELQSIVRQHVTDQAIHGGVAAVADRLQGLRQRVSNREISRDYTVDRYTELVDALFDMQLSTFGNAVKSSLFRKQMAFVAFSQAKETAGKERALLSAILSDHNFSAGRMLSLNNLRATEQARLVNFTRLAEPDAERLYREILQQPDIKEAERIRQKVKAAALWEESHGKGSASTLLAVALPSPEAWFQVASIKIDAMKVLEDSLNEAVGISAEQEESRAWQELLLSALLVLFAFVLAGILVRQIQTGRRVAEHQLNLAEAVFANSVESILVTDAEQRIIEVNPAFLRVSGYSREEIIGQHPRILKSGRHDAAFYQQMWKELALSGSWEGEVWNRRKSGEIYPALLSIAVVKGPDGQVTNYTGMIFDLSQQKTVEALLDQLRTFDGLTALPNRESWLSA